MCDRWYSANEKGSGKVCTKITSKLAIVKPCAIEESPKNDPKDPDNLNCDQHLSMPSNEQIKEMDTTQTQEKIMYQTTEQDNGSKKTDLNVENTEAISRSELEKFYQKLSSLEIQWPGGGAIDFGDDQKLQELMNCQYPNWKTSNKVISVPTARLPKMFLQNVQLSKQFQKRFNATQKGEDGEIKVYKQFVNELNFKNEGLIVLPNVDGSHVFETGGIGSVEIDMIVAHPLKGIFNFNVKNSQIISAEKMKQETIKHNRFLRYLAGFNFQSQNLENSCSSNSSSTLSVPIHSVFCDLHGNSSKKWKVLKIQPI